MSLELHLACGDIKKQTKSLMFIKNYYLPDLSSDSLRLYFLIEAFLKDKISVIKASKNSVVYKPSLAKITFLNILHLKSCQIINTRKDRSEKSTF